MGRAHRIFLLKTSRKETIFRQKLYEMYNLFKFSDFTIETS